ncbi:hypothetical protein HZS_8173, partial [Henneguya salminicola]
MSQIDTQFITEKVHFYENQPSTMISTPHYLLGDNTYRLPSMTLYESSMQLDDNSNSNNSFPQVSTIYQAAFQSQNLDFVKADNSNCWNGIQTPQNFTGISNDVSTNARLISWTPVLQPQSFIQQNNSSTDENVNKIVLLGNTVSDSNLSGYTLVPSSTQNAQSISYSIIFKSDYWRTAENFEYILPKENNTSISFTDDKISPQQTNCPNFPNDKNFYNQASLFCQNNCVLMNDTSIKNMENHHFPKRWLLINFERVDEDCTISRSNMYGYYVYACHERGECPMNPAGLGKVIRSVFGSIKNRRLGARGDSRYHYLGIKVKENSLILNISHDTLNNLISTYDKSLKNISKSNHQIIELKNCDSLTLVTEGQNNFNNNIMDTSKIKTELAYLEGLELKPLEYFKNCLQRISKLTINVQIESFTLQSKDNENMQQMYRCIFTKINQLFTDVGNQLIEYFGELNERAIYNCIKIFWSTDHNITVNSLSQISLMNNCKEFNLKFLINYPYIEKYVHYYDCVFLRLLLSNTVGNINNNVSVAYINKICYLFKVMHNALNDGLSTYSQNFIKYKLESLQTAIDIINDYKELYLLRIESIKNIINEKNDNIIKVLFFIL